MSPICYRYTISPGLLYAMQVHSFCLFASLMDSISIVGEAVTFLGRIIKNLLSFRLPSTRSRTLALLRLRSNY